MSISINGPRIVFTIPLLGGIPVTETVVTSWLLLVVVLAVCLLLTRRLERIPTRRSQQLAERIVLAIDGMVESTMGRRNRRFAPYILTLMTFSLLGSLVSLIGLRPVTADLNVTLTWAAMTFFLVHASGIRAKGLRYFRGFADPPLMLPLNLISELATPISLSFRHFGNLVAGHIITTLVYGALGALTTAIFGITFPLLAVGLPAFLSVYFDLFSGCIQAYVFCMLTMVFVSSANDVGEEENISL